MDGADEGAGGVDDVEEVGDAGRDTLEGREFGPDTIHKYWSQNGHCGTAFRPCRRRRRHHVTGKDGNHLSRVARVVALTEIGNCNSGRALLTLDRYAF